MRKCTDPHHACSETERNEVHISSDFRLFLISVSQSIVDLFVEVIFRRSQEHQDIGLIDLASIHCEKNEQTRAVSGRREHKSARKTSREVIVWITFMAID